MSSFRKALEDSYDEEMAAVYASASYVKLDAAVDMTITALSSSLDKDQEKLLNNLLNITVQMYPCSEGTDTGSPAL